MVIRLAPHMYQAFNGHSGCPPPVVVLFSMYLCMHTCCILVSLTYAARCIATDRVASLFVVTRIYGPGEEDDPEPMQVPHCHMLMADMRTFMERGGDASSLSTVGGFEMSQLFCASYDMWPSMIRACRPQGRTVVLDNSATLPISQNWSAQFWSRRPAQRHWLASPATFS